MLGISTEKQGVTGACARGAKCSLGSRETSLRQSCLKGVAFVWKVRVGEDCVFGVRERGRVAGGDTCQVGRGQIIKSHIG